MTEPEILRWVTERAVAASKRRDWSQLPPDFEAVAVTAVFMDIKRHFGKDDIRRRIKASAATTFKELLEAVS